VWLNFIPVFCLGWFIYTVIKVRDSVRAEYGARGWPAEGDFGYNVGIAAGVLWIAAFLFWWIPFIGWLLGIGWLVCWILYWLKTSDLKKRLDEGTAWRGTAPSQPYSAPGQPYSGSMPPYGAPRPPAAATPYTSGPRPSSAYAAPATAATVAATAAPDATAVSEAEEGERRRLCAACGASYDLGDKYCRSCGLPLP
jgi:hypothetical protein